MIDSVVDVGIISFGRSSIYWTTVGQFNKDRFKDLLLGNTSIVGGDVTIYLGDDPLDTIVDWHYRDYEVGDYGAQVGAADVNGDGVDEAIVGDPGWWYNNPSFPPGKVYIYKNPYTAVEEEQNSLPKNFALSQNYPNPFNSTTTVPFQVGSGQWSVVSPVHITLRIYNVRGQLVRTLVDEDKLSGSYKVVWDSRDNSGKEVTSGVYFYQLKAGNFKGSKKLLLIK